MCAFRGPWGRSGDDGFEVQATNVRDVAPVKQAKRVPGALASCHTDLVGGNVIEGSPGMEGPNPEPYRVLSFDKDGHVEVFETHAP